MPYFLAEVKACVKPLYICVEYLNNDNVCRARCTRLDDHWSCARLLHLHMLLLKQLQQRRYGLFEYMQ